MGILIRPMKIGDYEAVLRLWKKCFRRIYPQDRKEALGKTLERNPKSCLVAVSGGRIIGSIVGPMISGRDTCTGSQWTRISGEGEWALD